MTRSRRPTRPPWFLILGIALLASATCSSKATAEETLAGLEGYVTKAMSEWEVPGLAIAVVKDDKVVLASGYGVRKLGEDTPVDADTLFAIGSSSKAFTAACLAMLVDEGKIDWDDAVIDHLPDLQLHDPYATRELTVRDLLCHRCGLSRGDQLWYATEYDRAEILRRLRYLEPSWSFRSQFGYQNIMYLAAGQVAGHVASQDWDDLVKKRLFLPLGMTTACTSVTELEARTNVATPHVKIDDKVEVVAWRNIDNIAPAGSIIASVNEMAQWLRLQLGRGQVDGRRLISQEAIDQMHTAHTVIALTDDTRRFYPDAHLAAYGLGWFLHDYHGHKIVQHGGAIDGMRAQVALLPDENIGLVVLCNRGGSGLPGPLMIYIFDRLLGRDERDWSSERLAQFKEYETEAEARESEEAAKRAKDTKPSLPLEQYAGAYVQELYGTAEIRHEDGKLVLDRGPALTADLEHWHYDTFQATFRDRVLGDMLITFRLDGSGKVAAVDVPGLGEFTRKANGNGEPKQ